MALYFLLPLLKFSSFLEILQNFLEIFINTWSQKNKINFKEVKMNEEKSLIGILNTEACRERNDREGEIVVELPQEYRKKSFKEVLELMLQNEGPLTPQLRNYSCSADCELRVYNEDGSEKRSVVSGKAIIGLNESVEPYIDTSLEKTGQQYECLDMTLDKSVEYFTCLLNTEARRELGKEGIIVELPYEYKKANFKGVLETILQNKDPLTLELRDYINSADCELRVYNEDGSQKRSVVSGKAIIGLDENVEPYIDTRKAKEAGLQYKCLDMTLDRNPQGGYLSK